MSIQFHSTLKRLTVLVIAGALGIGLFASGVWAGSTRGGSEDPATAVARGSFWGHDPATGYPTGPAGQADFWNYDPTTGEKISDYSPGVAPDELAALWSAER